MLGFRRFGKVRGLGSVSYETKMISPQRFNLNSFKSTAKLTAKLTKKLTIPVLAMAGIFSTALPSNAIRNPFRRNQNEYKVCAARLLSVGIPAEAASNACAAALRPKEVSACVGQIQRKTQIPATDSLSFCGEARRPNDLATCVVGIGTQSQETFNPLILSYCSRSLLPVKFAQCVVGLRSEIDFSPTQAMDNCISASDRISNVVPLSRPRVPAPPTEGFSPTFETIPAP
ncbi:MAG: hypothetical protein AAGG00_09705 [Cyanobacteria bacterium P01_H01_bin.150]